MGSSPEAATRDQRVVGNSAGPELAFIVWLTIVPSLSGVILGYRLLLRNPWSKVQGNSRFHSRWRWNNPSAVCLAPRRQGRGYLRKAPNGERTNVFPLSANKWAFSQM